MTPLRRRMAALALVLVAPALTACGFNIQTDQAYQAADGVNDRAGQIDVLNALVVSSHDGEGRFIATLVNNSTTEPAKLLSISAEGDEASVGGQEILPENFVNLAAEAQVSLKGAELAPGKFIKVTLDFDNGQQTVLNAPIMAAEGDYADLGLAEPSASPSAAATTD